MKSFGHLIVERESLPDPIFFEVSIEFESPYQMNPQEQNALLELRRMLPGNNLGVVRGAKSFHLLFMTEYFSHLFRAVLLNPPRAMS